MSHILTKILKIIEIKKINTTDFTKNLNLDDDIIDKWKSSKSSSYMKHINKISLYLEIPVDFFLNNTHTWETDLHEDFVNEKSELEKMKVIEQHKLPSNYLDVVVFYYTKKLPYCRNGKLTEEEAELVNLYRKSNTSTKNNITSIIKILIKLDKESQDTILKYVQNFDKIPHKLVAKDGEMKAAQPPFDEKTTL